MQPFRLQAGVSAVKHVTLSILTLALALVSGCSSPEGKTPTDQKAYAVLTRDEALTELYQRNPEAKEEIAAASGYVFLSGFAAHPGLLTFANAYGIVQDNSTGRQTHIRMTRFGVGPGLAVKGYYVVATLDSPEAVAAAAEGVWTGGGLAEGSFKFGDFGGSASVEGYGAGTGHAWLWTHTGVAIELAAVFGKVYPESDLN
jgi:hypothetical protein